MFTRKINDSNNECSQKIQISNLAKMYFYLTTTVGNVMPWLNGFNPNGGLDIVQYKFSKYLGLYEWIQLVGNEPIGDESEDEKEQHEAHEQNERKEWIRNFVNNHYLQDFVFENNGSFETIKFLDVDTLENLRNKLKEEKDKKTIKEIWNLYFYRASKAIMKRSYRILENEKIKDGILSDGQNRKFEKLFFKFCDKYQVKKEVRRLMLYLRKSGQTKSLKKDYRQMRKYLKKCKLNNAFRYSRISKKGLLSTKKGNVALNIDKRF